MMRLTTAVTACAALTLAAPASAQTFAQPDPVLERMWTLGMEQSQAYDLAQTLTDSLGPRLTGSPEHRAANEWAVRMLESWGAEARNEQYGTWTSWQRGVTRVDLIEPRVRSLEAIMLAWSPGTPNGQPVEAAVTNLPHFADAAAFNAWLPTVRGKAVVLAPSELSCRPASHWQEYGMSGFGRGANATPSSFEKLQAARAERRAAYSANLERAGFAGRGGAGQLLERLEAAGIAAVLQFNWSNDIGVNKIFSASTESVPTIDLGCEDYGLVYRLAEEGQGPVVRIQAEAEFLGEQPVYNTIGVIPGTELPNEYVMLSAHYDSWDGGSGATDNATGSVTMLEAMRILRAAYPNPRRTIVMGLWGGEEQGLNGSRRFVEMHPDIVDNLQALFNQDNGTGRVVNVSMQGLVGAGAHWARWMAALPQEISRHIDLNIPGSPGGGGSDYASFVCAGAPGFSISSLSWSYGTHTWHTNRDSFDKIVMDDLMNNATLTAMLAYLASEDAERMPRDQAAGVNWPTCRPGAQSSGG
ncbi:MAG: M20/M25/M40 family metallo-hydrolase [Gemmatimonadota bacterium]